MQTDWDRQNDRTRPQQTCLFERYSQLSSRLSTSVAERDVINDERKRPTRRGTLLPVESFCFSNFSDFWTQNIASPTGHVRSRCNGSHCSSSGAIHDNKDRHTSVKRCVSFLSFGFPRFLTPLSTAAAISKTAERNRDLAVSRSVTRSTGSSRAVGGV